uniref:Taste receptor type 2 n=1 Tax=Pelusios castaneus TaxID=367368 RepID=A0A8C8VJH1_9SAUR
FLTFIIAQIILFMEIIMGMFGNEFIAAFYCTGWVKSRKLSSCDKILTCLVMSRIFYLGICVANFCIFVSPPGPLQLVKVQRTFGFLWLFSNTVCLWFTSCLSIFYCVMITNCDLPLFLQMKQKISAMVPKILLGSLLVTSVSSIPIIWGDNCTVAAKSWVVSYFYVILLYSAASFIPFIIFLSSSIQLIVSLWRHTRNMQHNATSFWDPSTEVHVRANKAMISCLILYIFNFAAVSINTLPLCVTDSSWTPAITSIMAVAFPSGHSLILILINPKLKQAMVRILRRIKCFTTGLCWTL